jgi:hypothetical protein
MNQVTWLRVLVANLVSYPLVDGSLDQEWLDTLPIVVGKVEDDRIICIKKEAHEPLDDLSNAIYMSSAAYRRGFPFDRIRLAVLEAITDLCGRPAESIGQNEVDFVERNVAHWFSMSARSRRLFIPCHIIPDYEKPFAIGPVSFTHWQDFVEKHDWVKGEGTLDPKFEQGLTNMAQEVAYYFAEVTVDGCSNERARELAELAVDVALVGLQLIIEHPGVGHMARMTARRAPLYDASIDVDGSTICYYLEPRRPGVRFPEGALSEFLKNHAPLVTSVGNRVTSFLSGNSRLPLLDQSWCDAAYWFHEGLAEPLDTIAVPMLETAIEVLFRSESGSGSERRLVNALTTFYGTAPDELIHPHSRITVRQLARDLVRDRSRILHGTWSTLATYLHESRPSLSALARFFLANFAVGLERYSREPEPDDTTESFLVWIEKWRREAAKPAEPDASLS